MNIFYAQYEATPLPESEDFGECGGAYINCWVKADTAADAATLALTLIEDRRWRIISVEVEFQLVTESLYTRDVEGSEHYQQAITDGECYVFHQWPVELH